MGEVPTGAQGRVDIEGLIVETTQLASGQDIEQWVFIATGVQIKLSSGGLGTTVSIVGPQGEASFQVTRGYDDMPVFEVAPSKVAGFSEKSAETQQKLVALVKAEAELGGYGYTY